jgi:transposase-like protein
MAKKSRRYSEGERAAILSDMERNGLTQLAAAKKHGVSTVTIWQWKRAAKKTRRQDGTQSQARRSSQARALRTILPSRASLDGLGDLVRAQVREQVRAILPGIIEDEVARALGKR